MQNGQPKPESVDRRRRRKLARENESAYLRDQVHQAMTENLIREMADPYWSWRFMRANG